MDDRCTRSDGSLATRCVHHGEWINAEGSPLTPAYLTTTFCFTSTRDMLDVVSGARTGNLYTRYGFNPTITALEEKLATLEGSEAALAFCSGMAAISATCVAHGLGGVICIGDAYGGTYELLTSQLPLLGIQCTMLLQAELGQLADLLSDGPKLVLFETPTNPTLEILDIEHICTIAHEHGALVAVDNTFASPVNQNPLLLGADIVVHSATKYLGGHSDLTAGAAMGSSELLKAIWSWRKNLGQCIAPETAVQLLRSIRTLPVRVERHNASAMNVAQALERHPSVSRVHYPGLASHPGHEVASRQMTGFGGMVSFEVSGSVQDATRCVDSLRLFGIGPSLGGVESLALQPSMCTHFGLGAEERARRGISDQLIRLSVGLEDPQDLIADLDQALAAATGATPGTASTDTRAFV